MKQASPYILAINGGSSSNKFALYKVDGALERRLYGKVDRIGLSGTNLTFSDPNGNQQDSLDFAAADHKSAASIPWCSPAASAEMRRRFAHASAQDSIFSELN